MIQFAEKYRPTKIEDFAGLERPRAILSNLITNPYSSAWLLVGPSGLGKTTISLAVAEAIGGEVHHIPSSKCDLEAVDTVVAKCHYFPFFGKWHFILVDEADRMSRAAQLAFLSKLDTTAAPPQTIFFFTANETKLLEDRFMSRCRLIEFDHEGMTEPACELLARIWATEAPGKPEPDYVAILEHTNYNLRSAIGELELEMICPSGRKRKPPTSAEPLRPVVQIDDDRAARRRASALKSWETMRRKRAASA